MASFYASLVHPNEGALVYDINVMSSCPRGLEQF